MISDKELIMKPNRPYCSIYKSVALERTNE